MFTTKKIVTSLKNVVTIDHYLKLVSIVVEHFTINFFTAYGYEVLVVWTANSLVAQNYTKATAWWFRLWSKSTT